LINSTETLPSDVESPVEIQASHQERYRIPTDSNMDETSSTMVMIAQSKALFDRLEMEAKVRNSFSLFWDGIFGLKLRINVRLTSNVS